MWCFLLLTLFVTVQGRAVNISNTWVLPEEGFPVFYRYFRDRISWYEADAVCQFHHANLVTVDTTAQYDAVRAYLKELDISSAVWVGLIRSNPDGDFTWTDYRGLSGEGYWSAAPDARSAPLCAAADPAADYRWEARACGGPSVASFICELPVPQWALGNEGCMVRALPALTVLYLPESAAVQLTADCGLAGVKRVQCTGNVKREDLLQELSCAEEEPTNTSTTVSTSIISWQTTTDTAYSEQDVSNEVSTEENTTTEHEDDVNQSSSVKFTTQDYVLSTTEQALLTQNPLLCKLYKIPLEKNINTEIINNNLQNNDFRKINNNDDLFTNDQTDKYEDEKVMQHKKLHDELARLENLETVFSQPTDHFVPPLVMAKAKINDDMTAISIEEKLAQQYSDHQFIEHNKMQNDVNSGINDSTTTEISNKAVTTENSQNNVFKRNDDQYTTNSKNILPKKYSNKLDETKSKSLKNIKSLNHLKLTNEPASVNIDETITTTVPPSKQDLYRDINDQQSEEDTSLELTVIIKEPIHDNYNPRHKNYSETMSYDQNVHRLVNKTKSSLSSIESLAVSPTLEHKVIMNDEVIKIEIINSKNKHSNIDVKVFEVTTKMPVFQNYSTDNTNNSDSKLKTDLIAVNTLQSTSETETPDITINDLITASIRSIVDKTTSSEATTQTSGGTLITVVADLNAQIDDNSTNIYKENNSTEEPTVFYNISITENNDENNGTYFTDNFEKNITDTTPEIDEFQSPLLSAANEPLHKPSRSRRPAIQNRVNKFNPFRILG